MAFICSRCAPTSGVSEFEQTFAFRSVGPCECCKVQTSCIDSSSYTSLTNGRVRAREDLDVAVLVAGNEGIVFGVQTPKGTDLSDWDTVIGESLNKAKAWMIERGWVNVDSEMQKGSPIHKDSVWADCIKHFFAKEAPA